MKQYPCLDDYDIYAGDGHYHAAAVHDRAKDGKKYPVQHFYTLDLRTHALNHLTQADVSGNRKKEHDMRALKRMEINKLRNNAPTGRKVIFIDLIQVPIEVVKASLNYFQGVLARLLDQKNGV